MKIIITEKQLKQIHNLIQEGDEMLGGGSQKEFADTCEVGTGALVTTPNGDIENSDDVKGDELSKMRVSDGQFGYSSRTNGK